VHRSFLSYTAVVIEVAIGARGRLTIPRVDIAFDCGAVPDRVRAQLKGAVVQGISLATLGEISFKNGRVEQTNFDSYDVTRIDVAPQQVIGEPGLPPLAPALANAIYAACGKRIRARPIGRQWIIAAGMMKEVSFEVVEGPINDLIDDAYRAKYQSSPYLGPMIGPRARSATVKVMPRGKAA
jgi:CO/xanthine dehydrogenase Mo-binding subunit